MTLTVEERIANLEDAMTRIEAIVNVPRYMSPRLSVEEWTAAKNAAPLLPSGDRNVSDRMREIGISQDSLVAGFAELRAEVQALAQRPSGSAGSVDVKAEFAALNIHVDTNRISIGSPIDYESQSPLQLGGNGVAAEIQGRSNTQGTDGQNPGEPHLNTFVVCDNDGGMRGRQYMKWFNGKKIRNTTNRPGSIFALFDSMGDTCISDDRWARGQFWYLVKGLTRGFLSIYQPGVTLEIRETSVEYSASDVQKL